MVKKLPDLPLVKTVVIKRPAKEVKKRPASRVAMVRHQDIVAYIKEELAEWVAMLGDDHTGRNTSTAIFTCPVCARMSDRRRNMVRHADTHTHGKLAAMFGSLESGERCPHPVYMEVVRALWESDCVQGDMKGRYCARAQSLLSKWTWFQPTACGTESIFTVLGARDISVSLVLTKDGPQYWLSSDRRLNGCKAFGPKQYYDKGFANKLMQCLMEKGGVYARAFRTLRVEWQNNGCEVTQLACSRSQTMASLACDLMESSALSKLSESSTALFHRYREYTSVSVDATYKLALKVPGQTRDKKYCWMTVLGMRGSPFGSGGDVCREPEGDVALHASFHPGCRTQPGCTSGR